MNFGFVTNIGKLRRQNEDCVYVNTNKPYYMIVADGMGGHNAGEVASKMAIDEISENFSKIKGRRKSDLEDKTRAAFTSANNQIYEYAEKNSKLMGMGTTAVTAIIHSGHLVIGNVGDSRAYIIKDKEIQQISEDHSYVWQLVIRGEITHLQAKRHPKRNFITRAMGTEKEVLVDTFVRKWEGGIVLLCSDGLTNLVDDNEIRDIVLGSESLQTAADKLVELANDRGGNDNITIALMGE